ncbi:hypothetical protein BRC86_08535 [Halobacteriales archaeon QS_3_64_16]|nr:MAG: hypothetical protein BRC86_08535 [Halobacteriales archaeon QS_3_64_16]
MDHQFLNYCLECEWTASTDGYTRGELSRLAVDHACSTGHDIAGERHDDDRDGPDRLPDREERGEGDPEKGSRPTEASPEPSARQSPRRRRVYSLSDEFRTDRDGHEDGRTANGDGAGGEDSVNSGR